MRPLAKAAVVMILFCAFSLPTSAGRYAAGTTIMPDGQLAAASDVLPAWLAGHWEGSGFGGGVEETWTPPRDGTMLGTFRLSVGGEARLFEFMILYVEDGHPAIRVKHFNADATPWEDRNEWVMFPFERSSEEGLFFAGLSYELLSSDELRVAVTVGHDGTSEIEELRLRKVIE